MLPAGPDPEAGKVRRTPMTTTEKLITTGISAAGAGTVVFLALFVMVLVQKAF